MTPIYRASTTLLVESQAPNVVSIQEVYGLDTRSQDYLATQIEIMGGRPIAETVVDGLGLIEQPEFRPEHPRPLIGLDWPSWLPFGMQQRASPSQPNERERAGVSGTGADRRRDRAQGIACRGAQQPILPAAGSATNACVGEDCLPAGHAGGWTRGIPAGRSGPARGRRHATCPGGPGDCTTD